jgi:hypothetical protein
MEALCTIRPAAFQICAVESLQPIAQPLHNQKRLLVFRLQPVENFDSRRQHADAADQLA